MSLSDLEKRAVLKPVEAELDRQKEKAAKFKKELVQSYAVIQELVAALEECTGSLEYANTYKGEYLNRKHLGAEEVAAYRKLIAAHKAPR
jgi:hypothetical protein